MRKRAFIGCQPNAYAGLENTFKQRDATSSSNRMHTFHKISQTGTFVLINFSERKMQLNKFFSFFFFGFFSYSPKMGTNSKYKVHRTQPPYACKLKYK